MTPGAYTSPRPPGATDAVLSVFTADALLALRRAARAKPFGKAWLSTGQCNAPGWVLCHMHHEGLVEFRKADRSSPNMWRAR